MFVILLTIRGKNIYFKFKNQEKGCHPFSGDDIPFNQILPR